MEREQIIEKLTDILYTLSDVDEQIELSEDDILNDGELGLDSLIMVQLIVEIEREFDIEIDDEYLSMDFLSTLGTIADFIMEEMKSEL